MESIKQKERRWQDRRGGALQEAAWELAGIRAIHQHQFARIASALAIEPGLKVLDIGCGVGHLLAWLSREARVGAHGIDVSGASLIAARRSDEALALVAGEAESLPYGDATFDRVVCNGSAHHLVDKPAAFREIGRVLKPGGRLLLHEPAATPFTTALRALVLRSETYESPVDLAHKKELTLGAARELLTGAGFAEIAASRHDFLAYPLSGNYLRFPLGRSRSVISLLLKVEQTLSVVPLLRSVLGMFAWRMLIVSVKPSS